MTAEGTFQIWVYLLIVGGVSLLIIPNMNYHLSAMGKLRVQCLMNKSEKQKSSRTIMLERWIDEKNYPLLVLIFYCAVSICFCAENWDAICGDFAIFRLLVGLVMWVIVGIVVLVIGTGLMDLIQETALRDLKKYYDSKYHITLTSIDRASLEEYYDYTSLNC